MFSPGCHAITLELLPGAGKASGGLMSAPEPRTRSREVFPGPRLPASVAPFRRVRSAVVLVVLSALFGLALAAALAAGIGFVVDALLHAVGTNS